MCRDMGPGVVHPHAARSLDAVGGWLDANASASKRGGHFDVVQLNVKSYAHACILGLAAQVGMA